MKQPTILLGGSEGFHNGSIGDDDLSKRIYKDASTVVVIPTRGQVSARVIETWWALMTPMNHPFVRMFVEGMEVGHAYQQAVETILAHPMLKGFKYMLTLEEDNMPPPDGLLRLLESVKGYAAVGGLYWTKGPDGQPMVYGTPGDVPEYAPRVPEPEKLQECNGLGMGFTLFDLDVFRSVEPPWFVTMQEYDRVAGARAMTQDLYCFDKLRKAGHKIACDTRVRVGHYDKTSGVIW
jgi:hypothetical protein